MKLRVNLSLTNVRQIDVAVDDPNIYTGDMKALIFAAAKRELGEYDEIRIVSVEEIIGAEDAPLSTEKISIMIRPGDRVLYLPPTVAGQQRVGTVRTTSGQSALVLYDGDQWPTWVPLARLWPVIDHASGGAQLLLITAVEP